MHKILFFLLAGIGVLIVFGAGSFYPIWRVGDLISNYLSVEHTHVPWIVALTATVLVMPSLFALFAVKHTNPLRKVFKWLYTIGWNVFISTVTLMFLLIVFEIVNAIAPSISTGKNALVTVIVLLALLAIVIVPQMVCAFILTKKEIALESDKVKQPLRIAHISDVHIGSRGPKWLRKVCAQIQDEKPDMLLISGDLYDLKYIPQDSLAPLNELAASLPVFYSMGNHELATGDENVERLLATIRNVVVLRDQGALFPHGEDQIAICGVEDKNKLQELKDAAASVVSQSSFFTDSAYRVLIHHEPFGLEEMSESPYNFDLYVSGHTHGGQLFPLIVFIKAFFRTFIDLYVSQNKKTALYVSPGTGTWGPTLRIAQTNRVAYLTVAPALK